jgi:hypothetical protein
MRKLVYKGLFRELLNFCQNNSHCVSGDGITLIYIYIYIQRVIDKRTWYIYYIKETLHDQKYFRGSDGDASWLEK